MEAKPKTKVGIILPSLGIGGAERLVIEELSYFKDDKDLQFNLHLIFEKGPLYDQVKNLGIPIFVWNAPHKSWRMLVTYTNLANYLRRNRYSVLHSHLLDAIGPIIGRLSCKKVISTVHSDKAHRAVEKMSLAQSDFVIGCGEQVVKNIISFVPKRKVFQLNNAIGIPQFDYLPKSKILESHGLNPISKLVLSIGSLTPHKNFELLIKSFRLVTTRLSNVSLIIVGEGDERKKLQALINDYKLINRIALPGIVNNIHPLLSSCDLYVNSSLREGLPMTLIEAISHGKPVVASNVGGNSEIVKDGLNGYLMPPNDIAKLSQSIIKVLIDENFQKSACSVSLQIFASEYRIEKHCERLKNIYLQRTEDGHVKKQYSN